VEQESKLPPKELAVRYIQETPVAAKPGSVQAIPGSVKGSDLSTRTLILESFQGAAWRSKRARQVLRRCWQHSPCGNEEVWASHYRSGYVC
jgi:hypothetical protein